MAKRTRNAKDILKSVRELRRGWREEADQIYDDWVDRKEGVERAQALVICTSLTNFSARLGEIENDLEYLAQ